jgi:hypothetical protein
MTYQELATKCDCNLDELFEFEASFFGEFDSADDFAETAIAHFVPVETPKTFADILAIELAIALAQ